MKPAPASYLVDGLHQLVNDIDKPALETQGLDGVVCGHTDLIGFYDDRTEYCGQNVARLCKEGSFEAVMWLLLNDEMPDSERLADCCSILSDGAVIDQPIADMVSAVPLQTRPLDLFPVAISLLSCFDPTPCDRTLPASRSQFWRVMAQTPVLMHVAFGGSLNEGRAITDESRTLSWAGQLLQILRDDHAPPTPREEHAFNVLMICQCLTEMRPACFLMRLFGSIVNDVVAGLKASSSMYVSQLRNDPYTWMSSRLRRLRSPQEAESWFAKRSSPIPCGFEPAEVLAGSHPEEDNQLRQDPRALLLKEQCRQLLGTMDGLILESVSARLENLMAHNAMAPTMDWASTRLMMLLNVPDDRMSLAVGLARMVGWAAQTLEQFDSGVSLLPELHYAETELPQPPA